MPTHHTTACFIFLGSSLAHGVPCAYAERLDLHTELLMRLLNPLCPNHHYLLAAFCPNHHYLLAAFCPNHHYLLAAFLMHPLFLCGLHMDNISTIIFCHSKIMKASLFGIHDQNHIYGIWNTKITKLEYVSNFGLFWPGVAGVLIQLYTSHGLSLNVHVNKLMTSSFQLQTLLFIT